MVCFVTIRWRCRGRTVPSRLEWDPSVIWHGGRSGAQGFESERLCCCPTFIDISRRVRFRRAEAAGSTVRNYAREDDRSTVSLVGVDTRGQRKAETGAGVGWSTTTDLRREEYSRRGKRGNLESEVICLSFFLQNCNFSPGFQGREETVWSRRRKGQTVYWSGVFPLNSIQIHGAWGKLEICV